jgi:hypothetical protein
MIFNFRGAAMPSDHDYEGLPPELNDLLKHARYLCEKPTLPRVEDIDKLRKLGKAFERVYRREGQWVQVKPPADAAGIATAT